MPAIITDQYRILNAETFIDSFVGIGTTGNNNYYTFLGHPNPTYIDVPEYGNTRWLSETPNPTDSFSQENRFYDSMLFLKKVTPDDVRRVVHRLNWQNETIYEMYKNNYTQENISPQTKSTSLYPSNYFILTSEFKVYVCINNGSSGDNVLGNISQDEPTFTDLEPSKAGNSGDGYVWKYLFTVSPSDIIKFDSTEYITVPNSWATSTDSQIRLVRENGNSDVNLNQIKHVYIENAGTGYANGLGQEVDILGDGSGAKARVDVVNGKITDVTVSAGGKGYSYGIVDLGTLNSNVSSAGRAKLIPIIPPALGHGSDVYSELGTDKVIIYARFDDSTKDFPIDTKFAQVGIVKNPTKVGTDIIYTDTTYSSLQAFKFDTVSGTPIVGEEIKQVLTVSPNVGKVATGFVASYDKETKVLKYFRDRSLYFNKTSSLKASGNALISNLPRDLDATSENSHGSV